ncbi:hypothetical protein EV359DRAFT_66252 [Lentinula novae-zelandiae]|nr:hypothetical protein EV359DRAFT_66252 [Lentinula novae-zelandiae]
MLALSTALPHCAGAGRWDNIIPVIPSDDQLMLQYIHHITDNLLSALDVPVPMLVEPGVRSSDVVVAPSLEETGPFSSIGSCLSRNPPPLLLLPHLLPVCPPSLDLTGDNDGLYESEVARVGRVPEARESEAAASKGILKDEPL